MCSLFIINRIVAASCAAKFFSMAGGIKAAISLSFDDARLSQVDVGTPLFDQYGVKATFVLVPSAVEKRLDQWKRAAAAGHELGNHTLYHPCSGNFSWSNGVWIAPIGEIARYDKEHRKL